MPSSRLLRFGAFTFDPASGDLKSADRVVRLQPQVAAVLVMLIEQAGAVVSRADLQTRLWPATTVEFDEGINFCIRQLRLALSDDARTPRFIETLPKRGYRFLAPVITETTTDETAPSPPAVAARAGPGEAVTRARPIPTILVAGAALIVAVGLTALARGHRLPGQAREHDPIVLAVLPFAADTADSMMVAYRRRMFDQILADARTEQRLTTVTALAPGTTHVLSGSLTRHGNSVQIFVELVLAGDRRHLWADDILDSYAFNGNSTITADRIERSAARVLGVRQ
jgi:DNA-binding winged helix-turn-helix (wHTH) protein